MALTGGTSTAEVLVTYTVGGTATAGEDYTAPTDLTLTIGTGDATGTISIETLTDTVVAEGNETLEVTLSEAIYGYWQRSGRRRQRHGDNGDKRYYQGDGNAPSHRVASRTSSVASRSSLVQWLEEQSGCTSPARATAIRVLCEDCFQEMVVSYKVPPTLEDETGNSVSRCLAGEMGRRSTMVRRAVRQLSVSITRRLSGTHYPIRGTVQGSRSRSGRNHAYDYWMTNLNEAHRDLHIDHSRGQTSAGWHHD